MRTNIEVLYEQLTYLAQDLEGATQDGLYKEFDPHESLKGVEDILHQAHLEVLKAERENAYEGRLYYSIDEHGNKKPAGPRVVMVSALLELVILLYHLGGVEHPLTAELLYREKHGGLK